MVPPPTDSLGNAPTESLFKSFRNERYHGTRYASHDAMKAASFEYIEVFYKRTRQHSTLGYRSPVQYPEDWIKKKSKRISLHDIHLMVN